MNLHDATQESEVMLGALAGRIAGFRNQISAKDATIAELREENARLRENLADVAELLDEPYCPCDLALARKITEAYHAEQSNPAPTQVKHKCGCKGEFHDEGCLCSCGDHNKDPFCRMAAQVSDGE